ncbi:histidinol-phosphatase [Streptomyces sp. NPDC054884]|uniref:histidinol-phosphatase n=1 Tax=unclassified Streptomyces TaxID=2593676 RepID=UPI0029A9EAA8|nr:histidinol-phosphatase [Streptomyces sp. ME08-AFT2]MDX3311466.1 histidinol-phosphatase [Streptomyces sp. ME08-AFT2]
MKFDLHTHHARCGHARGELRDYVEAAISAGLDILGFSDHSPFFAEAADHHKPGVAMGKSEFPGYLAEAAALREEYRGRIRILIGVESDFFPEHVGLYRRIYEGIALDYVIGSVHVMGGTDIFDLKRWENASPELLLEEKEKYCELIADSARSGMFDILGHIDALRGNCPEIGSIKTSAVDRMLRVIAETDTVVEVNTSGGTKACGGWYPQPDVLERAAHFGVKITFGSDAHVPERIAEDHELVRKRLREIGYREWYVFEGRERRSLPL